MTLEGEGSTSISQTCGTASKDLWCELSFDRLNAGTVVLRVGRRLAPSAAPGDTRPMVVAELADVGLFGSMERYGEHEREVAGWKSSWA